MTGDGGSLLGRLGALWARSILPAAGLAVLLVAVQLAAIWMLGAVTRGFDIAAPPGVEAALFALPVAAHALFVALLTDGLIRQSWRPRPRAFAAGLLLALPILLFGWLDVSGASYGCADGRVTWRSAVPTAPWAWIGWLVLTLAVLPARLLGHGGAKLEPWPHRVLMLIPFAVILLVLGTPFQRHRINCTPPFEEGWGLFEGGAFMIPLLALFLFSMAWSLALVSAAAVRLPHDES